MTLTLRSAADAAARATKTRNEAQSARITILLFTRKGLRADDLRRSPGFAREDASSSNWQLARASKFLQTAFPEFLPVTGCDVLAYSCAAARELHPLPSLRYKAKTRKPKDI